MGISYRKRWFLTGITAARRIKSSVRGFSRLPDVAMLAGLSDSGECSLAKNSPIREPILRQVSRSLAEALTMSFEKVAMYSYRVSKGPRSWKTRT